MQQITSLGLNALQPLTRAGETTAGNQGIFENIFKNAIQSVVETDAEKTQAEYLLATGQSENPAQLTIAGTKAELSVQLLASLRNKALNAYSELTRMNL